METPIFFPLELFDSFPGNSDVPTWQVMVWDVLFATQLNELNSTHKITAQVTTGKRENGFCIQSSLSF